MMENTEAIQNNADAVDAVFDPPVTTDAEVAAKADTNGEIEKLKAELATAQSEAAKNKDGWQRSAAEFSNYKKRQESDNANLRMFATSALVSKVLPVLDDFDRAAKTMPESLRGMTWMDGMLLIQRKLQLVLESEGVKPIEVAKNDEFNPNLHEAVSHDDAEGLGVDSGHVIEELQKGYKLGERVIRPTLVRVAR
jgi:molecular chaperone GrpE